MATVSECHCLFEQYDTNSDGFLDLDEMWRLVKALLAGQHLLDPNPTVEALKTLAKEKQKLVDDLMNGSQEKDGNQVMSKQLFSSNLCVALALLN